jgi:hypothetical protein
MVACLSGICAVTSEADDGAGVGRKLPASAEGTSDFR